jgi:hypothetical protein
LRVSPFKTNFSKSIFPLFFPSAFALDIQNRFSYKSPQSESLPIGNLFVLVTRPMRPGGPDSRAGWFIGKEEEIIR